MQQILRRALALLNVRRATMPSRQGRTSCWTDGSALWNFSVPLAAPLTDGRWVVNNIWFRRGRRVQRDLLSHLAAHGVTVVTASAYSHDNVERMLAHATLTLANLGPMDPRLVPPGATTSSRARPVYAAPTTPTGTALRVPRLSFELEVEFDCTPPQSTATAVWPLGPVVRDGSLYHGWEFKTSRPQTLAEWRASDLPAVLTRLCAEGAIESHERAGLHVHVDRASFSPRGLVRLFQVVNHADQVLYGLSRRGPTTNYCRFRPAERNWEQQYRNIDKYSAVYLHPRFPTAELRLFRSTVHAPRLFAALEAADALWAYCEGTTLDATGVDWAEWVATHPNYQLLAAELRAQGALAPLVVPPAVYPLSTLPVRLPPPPPPQVRHELGLGPNSTRYFWNETAQQVEYRRGQQYVRSAHFDTLVANPQSTDRTPQWLREQLELRGYWAPAAAPAPAPTPPVPPAPTLADLPTEGTFDLGVYNGSPYRLYNGVVEFNTHVATYWQHSSSQPRDVFDCTHFSPTSQDGWVRDRLRELAQQQQQQQQQQPQLAPVATPPVLYDGAPLPTSGAHELGEEPSSGLRYRWNGGVGRLEFRRIGAMSRWEPSEFALAALPDLSVNAADRALATFLHTQLTALQQRVAPVAPAPVGTGVVWLGRNTHNNREYRWNHATRQVEFFNLDTGTWRPSTTMESRNRAWIDQQLATHGLLTPESLTLA